MSVANAVAEPKREEIASQLDALLGRGESNLITLLQEIQEQFGYIPPSSLEVLSEKTRTKLSRVYGVVTFYAQFYLEPRGKHIIRCCRGTACHVRGAEKVIGAIKRRLGIEEGETTRDMQFTLETVACLGACALAPVIVVDGTYHGAMTSRKVNRVLDAITTNHEEDDE
jgi:NADH:ubiquinone oxidoreductase subunit E